MILSKKSKQDYTIVFVGFILSIFASTIFFSYGVFFKFIIKQFHVTEASASIVGVIQWVAFGIASSLLGTMSDRVGVVLSLRIGTLIILIGFLLLLDFNFTMFLVSFGLFVGAGMSATYGPIHNLVMTRVSSRKRSLSLGIVMVAHGLGPFLFIPLITHTTLNYGIKFTFFCLLASSLLIFLATFLVKDEILVDDNNLTSIKKELTTPELTPTLLYKNFKVTLIHFFGCASHSIVLAYIFSYMLFLFQGQTLLAASILSIIAISGLLSRAFLPSIAMAIKGKNALIITLGFQITGTLLFLFHSDYKPYYYLASVIFGLGFAGEMVVFPVITKDLFKNHFGKLYGIQLLGMGIGMGAGILIGGILLENNIDYIKIFTISVLLGTIATAIVFSLKKDNKQNESSFKEIRLKTS